MKIITYTSGEEPPKSEFELSDIVINRIHQDGYIIVKNRHGSRPTNILTSSELEEFLKESEK